MLKNSNRENLTYHAKLLLVFLLHQLGRVEAIVILQNVTQVDGQQVSKVIKYNLSQIKH
jgi:hypothetical protein